METSAITGCLTPEAVKAMQAAGEKIRIVDVRSPEEFAEGHIPGAVNLPLDGLELAATKLDQNALYVTACGKGGGRSAGGAGLLCRLGFQAHWLCGGTFGWLAEN
jgi:rhodanese-related sulfurtransferase